MENKKRGGKQKGGQQHAHGTHGERTHQAIIEQINAGGRGERMAEDAAEPEMIKGRHKIHEDREQHDEADKNSEKNRLQRDRGEGGSAA